MTEDTGPFAVGEKVLVPHIDKFYEAKTLKAEYRADKQWYYFLHYTGWNKKWDEWVEQAGLMKCPQGDAALQAKKRGLKDKFQKKKMLNEFVGEATGVSLELSIPAVLKKQLLDDYEAVSGGSTGENKVVPLPRQPTVNDILIQYVQQALDRKGEANGEEEITHGLRCYFDKALHFCLLYSSERRQEAKYLMGNARVASSVYGAEHLLRLFVKLPELFAQTHVPDEHLPNLQYMLNDFLTFLAENHASFFLTKEQYVDKEVGST